VYEFVDDAHGSVFVESDTIYDSRDEDNIWNMKSMKIY
jgi:hypothetical protein